MKINSPRGQVQSTITLNLFTMRKYIKNILVGLLFTTMSSCSTSPQAVNIPKPSTILLQDLTSDVKDRPILYLLAHQDDELLALHKLYLDLKAGTKIHVVWITDGSKSANASKRQKESRKAMALLGVPDENLHFLGFPDQKSDDWMQDAFVKIDLLNRQQGFAQVVSPAYEGGNIDHDVAAFLAAQLKRLSSPNLVHVEYPLYNRYQGRRRVGIFLPGMNVKSHYLKVDDDMYDIARKAMKQYRSQRIGLMLMGFVTDKKKLMQQGVPYRLAPDYNFLQRPVEEPCDYERSLFHRASFESWQKNVRKFLENYPKLRV